MKTRAPPGREGSMERTKDFYNGMNYAKKQLQQREHERRRRKRYFIKQKLCGIAVIAVLGIATPFAPLLDLDIITISAFFMPIALSLTFRVPMSNENEESKAGEKWVYEECTQDKEEYESQQAELLSPTTEAIMQEISALQMQQTETQITLEMLMEQ